jgi:glycosyltransferase involved in cell wall biosynthesis
MRALITGDSVGGVFTYVTELTRALSERGVEAHVVLMGRRLSADQRRALRSSGAARVVADDLRLEWMPDAWDDVARAGDWLLRIADEVGPDVVHLNGHYAHGDLPWPAPTLVAGHSCVSSWHDAVRGRPAGSEWRRYAERVRAGLRAADLVVAPTAAMLRALERHHGPFAATAVVPNGRASNGLVREKEPFVFAAGRLWDEAKNVAALDRAAASLAWPVFVAGDGGGVAARPRHARLLGLIDDAELAERFARAAVFAAPALYEPFGLAPLEAGLAGCALVLGDIDSLREVWGDAALYADPRDDAAIAAALRRSTDDAPLRRRLGAAARARAARYTPALMADRYLELYERLAGRAEAAA